MPNHYHYFFSYKYDKDGEQGYSQVSYKFHSRLNNDSIRELIQELQKIQGYTMVIITFFHELECDCEERENEDSQV